MKGFQLSFFTVQDRSYKGKPITDWLLNQAQQLGIRGATVLIAAEGVGKSGDIHKHHFFELADQPVEVTMALTEQQAEQLFKVIEQARIELFYTKTDIEFGVIGQDN